MFSDAMAHHGWHEQNDNDRRQQPNRADNEIPRQGQVNCADRKKRQHRLPTRLGLVDMLG
jgi:hypothetical protein